MADFSSLSDTDESAIEELISQAQDLSILEQISAINCSSFTTLPSDLETRFRKLKSLPLTSPKSTSQSFISNQTKSVTFSPSKQNPSEKEDSQLSDYAFFSPSKQNSDEKKCLKPKAKSGSVSSPASYSNSSLENSFSYISKQNPEEKISSSPPAKQGCFFCSPKMKSRWKEKRNKDGDDEILSGLTKEQKRIIQRAVDEEEKISEEVDKIVNWAKRASTRMKDFDIEDQIELSDDDFDDVFK